MMSLRIRPQYDPLMQEFEIDDEGKQAECEEINDPIDSAQPELNVQIYFNEREEIGIISEQRQKENVVHIQNQTAEEVK